MLDKYQSGVHRAYTNIALIKYWGKRNEELYLPMTSSLSLTLDAFFTETQVTFSKGFNQDRLILNGAPQGDKDADKITRFLDLFREKSGINYKAHILSNNHVPTAAGLASSASAYAALAEACRDALNLDMSQKELSTYARQGSGSATRSLFGGFVQWHKGTGDDSSSSYAETIDSADWDIAMLVAQVDSSQKKVSSTKGMKLTRETSPFYQMWPSEVDRDLNTMQEAIKNRDIDLLGKTAEHNAMKMHATMIASYPSVNYFQSKSIEIIDKVHQLRESGQSVYYTMDAGPNVKIIAPLSIMDNLIEAFAPIVGRERLTIAKPGPAPHSVDGFSKVNIHD